MAACGLGSRKTSLACMSVVFSIFDYLFSLNQTLTEDGKLYDQKLQYCGKGGKTYQIPSVITLMMLDLY